MGKKAKPVDKPPKAATQEEITNDYSLKWHFPYRHGEALWSDTHQQMLRYIRHEGEYVVLATLNGIAELPKPVHKLTVRRTKPEGK